MAMPLWPFLDSHMEAVPRLTPSPRAMAFQKETMMYEQEEAGWDLNLGPWPHQHWIPKGPSTSVSLCTDHV